MSAVRNRAHDFFDTHVVPAVKDWRAAPTDLRLAMNAAVVLNQMADYFWHAYQSVDPVRVFQQAAVSDFRRELALRYPSFALLRDVAEAHKHVKLDRPARAITSAAQTRIGRMGWGEAEFGVGVYGGGPEVVIQLDNGKKRHFSALVEEITNLWMSLLT